MEKIKYVAPEMEITEFDANDVITASNENEYDEGGIH